MKSIFNKTDVAGTTRKQFVMIAVILVVAIVAGIFIVRSPKSGSAPGGEQTAAAAKEDDGHGHDNDEKEKKDGAVPAPAAAASAGAAPGAAGHKEEKIPFTNEQIRTSGVAVERSSAGEVGSSVQLPGEIRFHEDRTAHVVPRVAGVVDSVAANLGQQVKKGQVLAVISSVALSEHRSELMAAEKRLALAKTTADRERKLFQDKISAQQDFLQAEQAQREAEIAVANATQKLRALGATPSAAGLARYELRAPFDGMVVEKHISLGESVREDANVFTISDLSTVWAQVNVTAANLSAVRVGERAVVRATGFEKTASGTVSYVGALIGEQTRAATARVTLPNPGLAWRPGLFVTVELLTEKSQVPVTVSSDAIQMLENKPTVFVKVEGGFEPRQVEVGRTDGNRVEILKGLESGTEYAGKGSFAVKAQQGKGSTDHGH